MAFCIFDESGYNPPGTLAKGNGMCYIGTVMCCRHMGITIVLRRIRRIRYARMIETCKRY